MVVKKNDSDNKTDVLNKLKKYNDDLDKYLPKMNFDFLKDDLILMRIIFLITLMILEGSQLRVPLLCTEIYLL